MADLIEQSKQLVQLQIELERLKNGADTIQEFSISALQALEFVNQSQSDYKQTKEALESLEHHLNELKSKLEDSQLRTILSDIGTAIDRLGASNTELKPQIGEITEKLDQVKVAVVQLASSGESKIAELVVQIEGLQTQRQASDKKIADSIEQAQTQFATQIKDLKTDRQVSDKILEKSFSETEVKLISQLEGLQTQGKESDEALTKSFLDMKTGLDQKIRSLGGMSNKLIKNVDTNSAKSYRELENLNKLIRVALILIVIAIVVDLLPTISGLF